MRKQFFTVTSIVLWAICYSFIYEYFDWRLGAVLFFGFLANNLQQKKV